MYTSNCVSHEIYDAFTGYHVKNSRDIREKRALTQTSLEFFNMNFPWKVSRKLNVKFTWNFTWNSVKSREPLFTWLLHTIQLALHKQLCLTWNIRLISRENHLKNARDFRVKRVLTRISCKNFHMNFLWKVNLKLMWISHEALRKIPEKFFA